MNEDQFDDLKQFVATTVSQSEATLREELKAMEKRLTTRMDDGFVGIGDSIEILHNQLDDHEHRIAKLEEQAA